MCGADSHWQRPTTKNAWQNSFRIPKATRAILKRKLESILKLNERIRFEMLQMQTRVRFIHAICARCTCPHNVPNRFEYAIDNTRPRAISIWIECHTHTCTVHVVYTSICCYLCSRSVRLYRLIRLHALAHSRLVIPSLSSPTAALSLAPLAACGSAASSSYSRLFPSTFIYYAVSLYSFHSIQFSSHFFIRSLLCVLTQSLLCCVRFLLLWSFFSLLFQCA